MSEEPTYRQATEAEAEAIARVGAEVREGCLMPGLSSLARLSMPPLAYLLHEGKASAWPGPDHGGAPDA